jgi:hypothetical protein
MLSSLLPQSALLVCPCPEQVDPHCQHPLMFFVGDCRILHLQEGPARQLGTVATVFKAPLVYGAVVQRTYFGGHHFNGPECGAPDVATSGACFGIELAFITFESAGAKYHLRVILMQDTENPSFSVRKMRGIRKVYAGSAGGGCGKRSASFPECQPVAVAGTASLSFPACQPMAVAGNKPVEEISNGHRYYFKSREKSPCTAEIASDSQHR